MSRFPEYSKSVDFIQKYIFPGSLCPSITSLAGSYGQIEQLANRRIGEYWIPLREDFEVVGEEFYEPQRRVHEDGLR
jgi:hypothetical protein